MPARHPDLADVAGIASVIDGDTLEIHGQRIRLHGIDAPESRQLCRLDGKPWQCGKDAANALAEKIARRPVTCEDLDRDRHGGDEMAEAFGIACHESVSLDFRCGSKPDSIATALARLFLEVKRT